VLRGLRPADFTDDRFGLPTVSDILRELEKPGRDPRPGPPPKPRQRRPESWPRFGRPGPGRLGGGSLCPARGTWINVGYDPLSLLVC